MTRRLRGGTNSRHGNGCGETSSAVGIEQQHPRTAQQRPADANVPAQQGHNNSNHHAYYFVIGIPEDDPLPQKSGDFAYTASIEEQQQQQQREQRQKLNSDFIHLPNFRFRPANEGWALVVSNCSLNCMSNCTFNRSFPSSCFYHRGLVLGADWKLRRCGVGDAVLYAGAIRLFVRLRRLARPVQMHRRTLQRNSSGWRH